MIKSFGLHFKLPNWENISLCQTYKGKGKISYKKIDSLLDQTLLKRSRYKKKLFHLLRIG